MKNSIRCIKTIQPKDEWRHTRQHTKRSEVKRLQTYDVKIEQNGHVCQFVYEYVHVLFSFKMYQMKFWNFIIVRQRPKKRYKENYIKKRIQTGISRWLFLCIWKRKQTTERNMFANLEKVKQKAQWRSEVREREKEILYLNADTIRNFVFIYVSALPSICLCDAFKGKIASIWICW